MGIGERWVRFVASVLVLALVASGLAVVAGAGPAGASTSIEISSMPKGPDRFVDAAYRDLLGRASEPGGRAYWVGRLATGTTRTRVTLEMAHSKEWTSKVIASKFSETIGRAPTGAEQARWLAPLQTDKTRVANLVAWLYGTSAFYTKAGSTPTKWVDAVWPAVIYRAPTATERTAALARLKTTSRETEAKALVLSVAANGFRVDALYRLLLGRESEAGGRAFWASKLTNGDDLRLAAQLAGSTEYYTRSQGRAIDGTLEQPPTTKVATPGQVRSVALAAAAAEATTGAPTATAVLDETAAPAGTTHLSLPRTASAPDGYLGTVTSRTVNGDGSVTVGLAQARWAEAFPAGDFTGTVDATQPDDAGAASVEGAGRAKCSGSGNKFSVKAKTKFAIEVDAGWGPFTDTRLSFAIKGSLGAEADVLLGAAFTCDLAVKGWTIPFSIGPIPFTAEIAPTFKINGEIGAHLSGAISYGCTVGMEWREGTTKNLTGCKKETSRSELLPSLAQGKLTAALGIDLSVKAFGALGITLNAGPTITASVTPLATPWWKVTGGASASLKLVATLWILSAQFEFAKFTCCEFDIASAKTGPPAPAPLAITTTSLPGGIAKVAYDTTLKASGGIGPYTWAATGLPAPLTLNPATGAITGTPTAESSGTVTVTATDKANKKTTKNLTLAIVPLAISTTSLPEGTIGKPYSATVAAIGGTPPYTWAATGLPASLTIDPATGKITGIPSAAGSHLVTIDATAAGKTVHRELSVNVIGVPLTGVTAITTNATGGTSCALMTNHTVRCWGRNDEGQIGDGSGGRDAARLTAVEVPGINTATAVMTGGRGYDSTCALLADHTIRCWGSNWAGQLGDGTTGAPIPGSSYGVRLSPVKVIGISTATAIAVGDGTTCALLTDRTIRCWGSNSYGQLGDGTSGNTRLSPVKVPGISTATAITTDNGTTCALLADRTIRCWGYNLGGQTGDGTSGDANKIRLTPVKAIGITNATAIETKNGTTCALLADHTMRCWGWGGWGNLGSDGGTTSTPRKVTGINTATAIAVGGYTTCALLADQTVRCWGLGGYGQLGDGDTGFNNNSSTDTPVEVPGFTGVTAVAASGYTTMVIRSDTTIRGLGANYSGGLGDGTTGDANHLRLTPVAVISL